MKINIIDAIVNIVKSSDGNLENVQVLNKEILNRANNMGDALEYFIKDAFTNGFNINNYQNKLELYQKHFSYLGNKNNPPDIIIRGGDAIEVKKTDGINATSELQLNSSYPKDKIYANSPMITTACRKCEDWEVKDILYSFGFVKNNNLKLLLFVYGDCFSANKEIYERIGNKIRNGLTEMDLELAKTNELGRINGVDPMGITKLRIRGMWLLKNPLNFLSEILNYDIKEERDKFNMYAIMKKEKFESFSNNNKLNELNNVEVNEIKLPNPNNPAQLFDVIMVRYKK